jgi:SAM-dependent methyltransferase
MFHLANIGITDLLPQERVEEGGFSLIGGGVSVGITALTVAYTLGYRRFHLFGYDSSNRGTTHAYPQPMNANVPEMDVEWGDKVYRCSMPMKLQADAFFRYAEALKEAGVEITVHGSGLLPAMWNSPPMTEREKYQILWARGDYRDWSPGEMAVEQFLALKPEGLVLDFGCGTGRAAMKIKEAGHDVLLFDFTDNCRDKAALTLPFVQWDLTQPLPVKGGTGYCTDVMEHIPPEDVDTVLANIMAAVPNCFFQIATIPDGFGAAIGQTLHLTVQDHDWWAAKFPNVLWSDRTAFHSTFYVSR